MEWKSATNQTGVDSVLRGPGWGWRSRRFQTGELSRVQREACNLGVSANRGSEVGREQRAGSGLFQDSDWNNGYFLSAVGEGERGGETDR